MPRRPPTLQERFSRQTLVALRLWRRAADEAFARLGLSDATAWPLLHLARLGDGVRHGTLATALAIEGPSLVRLLDQLAAAGLVERRDDPADRRARLIHLTERGRAVAEEAETVATALRARLLAGTDPADLEASLRIMSAIQHSIQGEAPPSTPGGALPPAPGGALPPAPGGAAPRAGFHDPGPAPAAAPDAAHGAPLGAAPRAPEQHR
ncbi:MarR family transcriptional regulator [Roseomonas sp. NAR14]|uniref:MarR family transcriptional regulator n=1 Tax=Roseomonas acroporae TaxID=2937791 RepID=A0A9X1Y3Y8_9PROT|nr:MarR family transcriptional regulator [Roseomonas acroporae]MCK8783126.1 MarR family transcriptional regulator [Roseomonas acroporae]